MYLFSTFFWKKESGPKKTNTMGLRPMGRPQVLSPGPRVPRSRFCFLCRLSFLKRKPIIQYAGRARFFYLVSFLVSLIFLVGMPTLPNFLLSSLFLFSYHLTAAEAQVSPPPKATKRTMSPSFMMPSLTASSSAMGIEAAEVLPYLSTLL